MKKDKVPNFYGSKLKQMDKQTKTMNSKNKKKFALEVKERVR